MGFDASRLKAVLGRIESASKRAGRAEVPTLVAVSKGHPSEAIRAAFAAGQGDFGESYAQEMLAKARELSDLDIAWHFIGHLQRNKVRDLVKVPCSIHALDRAELADEIDRRTTRPVGCFIEVNVAKEPQKFGCDPDQVLALAEHIAASPHLKLRGLMAIPPAADDPEESRPWFASLRTIAERINTPLELSMGMSHDFEIAIEEGATLVRVGTDIFGPRPARGA